MGVSLYGATVPSFRQMLASSLGLLDKAEAHCREAGLDPGALIGARLIADMAPFAYQVKSVVVHSRDAIEGVRVGNFSPDQTEPPQDFAGLRARVAGARAFFDALAPDDVDRFVGAPMRFTFGAHLVREFLAEDFLLSFSLPNFYFHMTTAYDILRAEGVRVGKVDYLGQVRTIP